MSACCTFGGSSTFAMEMSSGSSGDGSIMASFSQLAWKASFGCAKDETASPRFVVKSHPLKSQTIFANYV
jgi:hypothetical protein